MPRYFYLRDENRFPVTCVASMLAGTEVKFAIATWNPADSYDKAMARDIACGRLLSGRDIGRISVEGGKIKARIIGLLVNSPPKPNAVAAAVKRVFGVEQHEAFYPANVPERAKRAARLWLARESKRTAPQERADIA